MALFTTEFVPRKISLPECLPLQIACSFFAVVPKVLTDMSGKMRLFNQKNKQPLHKLFIVEGDLISHKVDRRFPKQAL